MSDIDIQKLNAEQRLIEAARRSVPLLPPSVQHQVQEFIKPESLAAMKVLVVASQFEPAAPVIDAAVIVGTGLVAYEAVRDLGIYWQQASNAQSEAQLDEAAKHFANGILSGSLVGTSTREAGVRIARLGEQAAREAGILSQKISESAREIERVARGLSEDIPVTAEGVRVSVPTEELVSRPLESRAESRGNGTGQASMMQEAKAKLGGATESVSNLEKEGLSLQARAEALSEQAKTASPAEREKLLEKTRETSKEANVRLNNAYEKKLEVEAGKVLDDEGELTGFNDPVESAYKSGKTVRELDARGKHALIEVTASEDGKQSQIQKYFQLQEFERGDRAVILYAPNYTEKAAAKIVQAGGYVVRNTEELVDLYKDMQSGIKPSINPKAVGFRAQGLDPLSAREAFDSGVKVDKSGESYKYGFHEKEIYDGNTQGAIYKFPLKDGKLAGEGIPVKAGDLPKNLLTDLLKKGEESRAADSNEASGITQEQFKQLTKQAKEDRPLHPAFKAVGITATAAVTAQQNQPSEAKESSQPERVNSVSAKIIANGQSDSPQLEKIDNKPKPDPELAAVKTYEKLIDTQGVYDADYNVTRFKDGDYTARLNNDTNVLSVESVDRHLLLVYERNTQKLTVNQPLNEKDIQHFEELQNKPTEPAKEVPKAEPRVPPNTVQLTGQAASSFITQEQLDKVEDVARDYAYHHPDSQKAGENFSYQNKDYQFAQKEEVLTITAQDGRGVILQMNTFTRDIAVNKITPEDSRQMTQMSSTTALASERDAQARMVTDSALAVLDRYGKETKGGRFYSEGDYQISQQGDRKGAIQITDARNGNELLYAKAKGVVRENLGEDDIQNFTNLNVQMEQQQARAIQPPQEQREIGGLELGG